VSAMNLWNKSKSKDNCATLHTAVGHLEIAVTYYLNAKTDETFGQYAENELTRCTVWLDALNEDKWFYCK
jgi:hypothetical protein